MRKWNLCSQIPRQSRWEREWKEEGKQQIMKTSLISADTSPRLSSHCWNQYKFLQWDVLKEKKKKKKNSWLLQLSHLLSCWNNQWDCSRWKKGCICQRSNPNISSRSHGENLQVARTLDSQSIQTEPFSEQGWREEHRLPAVRGSQGLWFFYSNKNYQLNKTLVR